MLPPWCMALPSRLRRTASLVAGQPSGPTLGAFKHVLHVCRQLTTHSPRHLPRARRTAPHRLVVVHWGPCALCGHRALAAVDSQAAARPCRVRPCRAALRPQVRVLLAKHWPEIQPEKGTATPAGAQIGQRCQRHMRVHNCVLWIASWRIELPGYTPPTLLPTHLLLLSFLSSALG